MFRFSTISRLGKLQPVATKRSKSTKSKSKFVRKMNTETKEPPRPPTFIPERHWQNTKLQTMLQTGASTLRMDQSAFTIVSYNILAQDLLQSHPELYEDIPKDHLNWPRRKANLLREISHLQPDILCLQEIQSDHLEGFSADLLRRCTFEKVFKKRTGSDKTDGCAIFFNPDLFELMDHRTIEFNQQATLLDRDNVGIIIKLRSRKNPEAVVLVATTHLLFNPKRSDVRLAQVHVILAELEQMAYHSNLTETAARYYPIILTGDFNTEPSSPPYTLIADGKVDYQEWSGDTPTIIDNDLGITDNCQHVHSIKYGREKHQSQLINSERDRSTNVKRKLDVHVGFENHFNTGSLSHPLHLNSTYRNFEDRSSTHHHDWIIVDYLFYSRYFNSKFKRVCEGPLKLLSYLELPLTDDCQRMRNMPNEVLGSDHFSLAARFLLGSS